MPIAAGAGGEVYYEDAGQGEPVVFASGLNGVGRYWKPRVPLFLYSPDYVNDHDAGIEAQRRNAPTKSSPVEVSVGSIEALYKCLI
jgi:hypothetical protein